MWAREREFLSGFDFWPYLKGCTCGEAALCLPVQAVQETARVRAKPRAAPQGAPLLAQERRGAPLARSVPFKVRTIRYQGGQVYFAGQWLSLWDSFGLGNYQLRAGSFSEDARGRWYLNVSVEVPQRVGPMLPRALPALEVGIDLGLKALAGLSDGSTIEAPRFYRDLEPALAVAQRAGKAQRARALHAKISNRRKDFLHKFSCDLAHKSAAIFVGNVSASQLATGRHAKSVLDAGWSALRTMLRYKCDDAGAWFEEVNEAYSTQTCSACKSRTGPKGRKVSE